MNLIKQHLDQLAPSTSKESNITPNYEHLPELTFEEAEAAILEGRLKKDRELRIAAYAAKIREQPVVYTPSAKDWFNALLNTKSKSGENYQVTEENSHVVKQLCLYFANDSRFEGNLNKGILLMGKPGTGKTHLMNFFSSNPRMSYNIPTCKHIAEQYRTGWKNNDMDTIEYYSSPQKAYHNNRYNQSEFGICFGDLGAETEANNYGNKKNVIEEIVFTRYEKGLKFISNHFTTNLDGEDIGKIYGDRMKDRLREMCNVLLLNCKSWR
ncbi:MAG TPA: hypothetical protein VL443_30070 [Cyclobacteriaceae bacterium]|jgi:DNA replication protein DnaC|nr:hypothetical protein [Cyclobacteriaceae bacterium]